MKKYKKPIIHEHDIDREICLIFMSYTPTDNPDDENNNWQSPSSSETTTSSDEEETTKTNNFDENPFQR